MNRIKLYGILVLAAVSMAAFQPAQAQLAFSAGLNFNQVSDIEFGDREATFDNKTGWHVALWYDLPLGPVALQPGLRYMDAGELYQGFQEDGVDIEDVSVTLVEVPLNLRLRMATPVVTPYVKGGPVIRIPLTSDDELNDDLETLSVAGELGAGLEVSLGGVRVFPEVKYTFGISRFMDDEFDIGDTEFVADESQHLNAVMISLAVGL